MKIAYRAFITILIAFAFSMTVIGFVKYIPLVFFLSLACIFVAIAFYIFKSVHYQVRYEWENKREKQLLEENSNARDKIWELEQKLYDKEDA